jgi:chemotaxis signal transduction protein
MIRKPEARSALQHFDWDALKRRVPRELVVDESPEALAQLFLERAAAVARVPRANGAESGESHLEFEVGEIRFAIALDRVRSILSPGRITRLPRAPEALSHVIHHEGRIVALVALGALLELPPSASQQTSSSVLLLDTSGSPLGVRVDRIHGLRAVDTAQLSPSARGSANAEVLRGITPDMALVLSVPHLVARLRELSLSLSIQTNASGENPTRVAGNGHHSGGTR